MLEHALVAIEAMGFGVHLPRFLVYLDEAYVLADRLEDALASAGRALTLAREGGQRGYEASALRLLGEVSARHDPPEHACLQATRLPGPFGGSASLRRAASDRRGPQAAKRPSVSEVPAMGHSGSGESGPTAAAPRPNPSA